MRRSVHLLQSLVLIVALGAPVAAHAESSAESFVKAKQVELLALAQQKGGESGKRIERIFDDMLDYGALAKASLRDHWDGRSGDERKEFEGILKELVRRAYRKNLDKTAGYEVKFEGETKGDDGVLVKTIARSKTNAREEPVEIDYLVRRVDGQWRVHDIVTEGSSLVNNYRQQFGRIIKKDGFAELVRRMKKKLDKES
jgi:phospholipid transport system substrate-binding protein